MTDPSSSASPLRIRYSSFSQRDRSITRHFSEQKISRDSGRSSFRQTGQIRIWTGLSKNRPPLWTVDLTEPINKLSHHIKLQMDRIAHLPIPQSRNLHRVRDDRKVDDTS